MVAGSHFVYSATTSVSVHAHGTPADPGGGTHLLDGGVQFPRTAYSRIAGGAPLPPSPPPPRRLAYDQRGYVPLANMKGGTLDAAILLIANNCFQKGRSRLIFVGPVTFKIIGNQSARIPPPPSRVT